MTEISRQSAVLAFGNVFYLMMFTGLLTVPLILLIRMPKAAAPPPGPAEAEQLV